MHVLGLYAKVLLPIRLTYMLIVYDDLKANGTLVCSQYLVIYILS